MNQGSQLQGNQVRHQVAMRQDVRPAQLAPEVIARFEREDIQALLVSFTSSVSYQNETDRMAMGKHYSFQGWADTRRMFIAISTFCISLGVIIFTGVSPSWIIFAMLGLNTVINSHNIGSAIKQLLRIIFKKENSPQDN